ncbi:MAG: hypothetical protein AAGJ74_14160 [Pseudomonadota bacterium]
MAYVVPRGDIHLFVGELDGAMKDHLTALNLVPVSSLGPKDQDLLGAYVEFRFNAIEPQADDRPLEGREERRDVD